jgi:hypothetical protein
MRSVVAWAIAAGLSTLANAAAQPSAPSGMTVAQILEKNAEARGGAEAWRKIETMIWVGHVESSNAQAPKLPFMLEQKRPNKTRFEIFADKQKSLRVFDGTNGWKMRFTGAGKPEVQAFTVGETSFARDAQVIDGPLIDSAAKGITVILAGLDDIEGRKAYRLDVRLHSGLKERVWIDAESFLDVKWEREGHGPGGRPATVVTYYRDYHSFEG